MTASLKSTLRAWILTRFSRGRPPFRRFGLLGSDSCAGFLCFLARCSSVVHRPVERCARLGELLFQKAALVFEAFRLAAQGLDFGVSFGSFAGFAFATGLDSGLPNLPKRVESFRIAVRFGCFRFEDLVRNLRVWGATEQLWNAFISPFSPDPYFLKTRT